MSFTKRFQNFLPENPAELNTVSIERLIRIAMHYRLLTDYHQSPRHIRLCREQTLMIEADPEQVRYYLQGLLCGYLSAVPAEVARKG